MLNLKYVVLAAAVCLILGFGAKYPTAEAKAYDFNKVNPHKGKLFDGCDCCHVIVCRGTEHTSN